MARRGRRRSRVSASDLAGYGSVTNGTVDIDRAARGLGVSKNEVRQALRQAQAAQSNTFLQRISGRREADSAGGASMRGMLQAVFGRGPRGAAVNARAAAQALGVSPGTVRRWAAGTQQPTPGRLATIRAAARRVSSTKRGRRAAAADFRTSAQGSKALRTGSKIWVSGEQGVGGYDQGYARDRRVATDISADEIEALLRAYEEGGDRALRDWLKQFFDDKYVAGWDFVTIDDFGIGSPE
ncbi:helix-turn-helix family protein [Mycobacterium kansasii]|uniref:Helix-turn-helix family protein n=1 Tax=Mycobacterium kansasii TaxID=1768 RepID=A0A1V3WEK1_MYCKA|nr:helix-turn-helix family protein [Mycobacterium kansasii]